MQDSDFSGVDTVSPHFGLLTRALGDKSGSLREQPVADPLVCVLPGLSAEPAFASHLTGL